MDDEIAAVGERRCRSGDGLEDDLVLRFGSFLPAPQATDLEGAKDQSHVKMKE